MTRVREKCGAMSSYTCIKSKRKRARKREREKTKKGERQRVSE